MGIFDALNTAVAGLQSQSYALQNISGNIANASTIGYKGINTSFEDLVAQASSPTAQVAGGVTALSQQTLTTSGTVSSSTVATNMAINGDGFFSVQKPTSVVDNEPVFNGVTDYTRAGDFQVNANGNLVNGAGYYLMGVTVDPKTGNPLGNVPQVLQFQNNFVPAQPTSNIQYAANLPTVPQTTASTTASPGTLVADGGLDPSAFSANPLVLNTPATPFGDNTVTGAGATNTSSFPSWTPGPITASTALSSVAVGTATGTPVDQAGGTTPITTSTLLSGTSPGNVLSPGFSNNETIVVNGTTLTFVTTAPTAGQISTTATVGSLLSAIDAITGTNTSTDPSTINATTGAITINDDAGPLTITSSSPGALASLGFSGTIKPATNSLTTSFAAGNTITVDTSPQTKITFYNSLAGGSAGSAPGTTYLDLATATVGSLLSTIDGITGTGNPSTINASTGAITLHTGTTQDLSVASGAAGFTALGFGTTMSAARTGGGTAGTGFVLGADLTTFDAESISGGAVTAYNAAGTPVNMQFRWVKSDSSALGNPHQDTWNLFYESDSTATSTQPAWTNVGVNFTFNSDGSLSSPAGSAITIPGVKVNNQSLGNITLNLGSGGLTQFASTTGAATINQIQQNGYAAGQLQSVAINNNGLVVGTFSNGQNLDLASVTLSHFNGTNYLQALSGEAYAVTSQSGPAIAGASGTISGSALEGSNTDIADEFTKLIVTQQAYSANTKVITTANDMVQDLLNVLR
jgi:flagellar hook protein FlgE